MNDRRKPLSVRKGIGGPCGRANVMGLFLLPWIAVSPLMPAPRSSASPRAWPNTRRGIHVFNDQLSTHLTEAQWRFCATRYAGTQKMTRSDADRLRAINSKLVILHYRLGLGLGYRAIENNKPTGAWICIIEGDKWVREWPGDSKVQNKWFFHWPQSGGSRVLNLDWGWYLMELNDSSWRAFWHAEVLRQVKANDDDGVFMDSLSVPNYLGGGRYTPKLPDYDAAFEAAWATRIDNWLAWLQGRALGKYYIVPNVGSWITTRETTTYARADGLMVEGFALEADASPLPIEDWRLQMNRILGAVKRGQAVINQTYVMGVRERLFTTGCYLLVKGDRTYLNIDLDVEPEWWPEYDIPIGAPVNSAGTSIENLYDSANQVYRRKFDNGFVLVNPTSPWDGTGITVTIKLGGTYRQAVTSGGGEVPANGKPTGRVTYKNVTKVTLPPYSAAILLNPAGPSPSPTK